MIPTVIRVITFKKPKNIAIPPQVVVLGEKADFKPIPWDEWESMPFARASVWPRTYDNQVIVGG